MYLSLVLRYCQNAQKSNVNHEHILAPLYYRNLGPCTQFFKNTIRMWSKKLSPAPGQHQFLNSSAFPALYFIMCDLVKSRKKPTTTFIGSHRGPFYIKWCLCPMARLDWPPKIRRIWEPRIWCRGRKIRGICNEETSSNVQRMHFKTCRVTSCVCSDNIF